MHVRDLAIGVRILNDAIAEITEGSIGRPEWAQDDVGGGGKTLFRDDFVCNLVN